MREVALTLDQVPDIYEAYNRRADPAPLPDFLAALALTVGSRLPGPHARRVNGAAPLDGSRALRRLEDQHPQDDAVPVRDSGAGLVEREVF